MHELHGTSLALLPASALAARADPVVTTFDADDDDEDAIDGFFCAPLECVVREEAHGDPGLHRLTLSDVGMNNEPGSKALSLIDFDMSCLVSVARVSRRFFIGVAL